MVILFFFTGRKRKYSILKVKSMLDLSKYEFDLEQLCRSLRRDDLTYSYFATLVGKLFLESTYLRGEKSVNYLQMRVIRQEVENGIYDLITALENLPSAFKIDVLGSGDALNDLHIRDSEYILAVDDNEIEDSD